MDWMAQGTRITGNLLYDNTTDDLYVEVNHGPFLADNNLFLSRVSLYDMSEGGAYVHNLMTGTINSRPEPNRSTPYHPAHSTAVTAITATKGGDNRFYNNIFVGGLEPSAPAGAGDPNRRLFAGFGLWVYDTREYPLHTGGNVYYRGARPYDREANWLDLTGIDPKVELVEEGENAYLRFAPGETLRKALVNRVTTALLGEAKVSGAAYENPDGSPLTVDTDYFGQQRNESNPTAGPFETTGPSPIRLKIW